MAPFYFRYLVSIDFAKHLLRYNYELSIRAGGLKIGNHASESFKEYIMMAFTGSDKQHKDALKFTFSKQALDPRLMTHPNEKRIAVVVHNMIMPHFVGSAGRKIIHSFMDKYHCSITFDEALNNTQIDYILNIRGICESVINCCVALHRLMHTICQREQLHLDLIMPLDFTPMCTFVLKNLCPAWVSSNKSLLGSAARQLHEETVKPITPALSLVGGHLQVQTDLKTYVEVIEPLLTKYFMDTQREKEEICPEISNKYTRLEEFLFPHTEAHQEWVDLFDEAGAKVGAIFFDEIITTNNFVWRKTFLRCSSVDAIASLTQLLTDINDQIEKSSIHDHEPERETTEAAENADLPPYKIPFDKNRRYRCTLQLLCDIPEATVTKAIEIVSRVFYAVVRKHHGDIFSVQCRTAALLAKAVFSLQYVFQVPEEEMKETLLKGPEDYTAYNCGQIVEDSVWLEDVKNSHLVLGEAGINVYELENQLELSGNESNISDTDIDSDEDYDEEEDDDEDNTEGSVKRSRDSFEDKSLEEYYTHKTHRGSRRNN